MASSSTRSKRNKKIIGETETLRDSPDPIDSDMDSLSFSEKNKSEPILGGKTAGIHHHIPSAFGAPFIKADGLVHRGINSD